MKHRDIRKFKIDGVLHQDSDIPRIRAQMESLTVHDLRARGYVPVLDLDTQWATAYDEETDTWTFTLSVYGMYLGKRKAYEWEGFSGNSLVPKTTRKGK